MPELNAALYGILCVGVLLFLLQDQFVIPHFFVLGNLAYRVATVLAREILKPLLYLEYMYVLKHYNPISRFQTLIPVNRLHMPHRQLVFRLTVHPAAVVFSRVCRYYVE